MERNAASVPRRVHPSHEWRSYLNSLESPRTACAWSPSPSMACMATALPRPSGGVRIKRGAGGRADAALSLANVSSSRVRAAVRLRRGRFRLRRSVRPAASELDEAADSPDPPDLSRTKTIGRASATQGVDGISNTVHPVGIRNTVHPRDRSRRRLLFAPRHAGVPPLSDLSYLPSPSS